MKTIKHIYLPVRTLLILVMSVIFCGCTHNNGDIGQWFGTWQITSIDINGSAEKDYHGNMFWKFQNNIIEMVLLDVEEPDATIACTWGTWAEDADCLLLNFTHTDNEYDHVAGENWQGRYFPLGESHLPYGEITRLRIVSSDGNKLTLSYESTSQPDIVYTYTLIKR